MNRSIKRGAAKLGVAATMLLMMSGATHANGSSTLSLSPTSPSVTVGGDITYNVVLDPAGDHVNSVEMNLSYPAANFASPPTVTCLAPLPTNAGTTDPGPGFQTDNPSAGLNSVNFTCSTTGTPANAVATIATVTFHSTAVGTGLAFGFFDDRSNGRDNTQMTATEGAGNRLGGALTGATAAVTAAPSGGTSGGNTSGGGTSGGTTTTTSTPKLPKAGRAVVNGVRDNLALSAAGLAGASLIGAASYIVYRRRFI